MLERIALMSAHVSVGVRYLVLAIQMVLLFAVGVILLGFAWHLATAFYPLVRAILGLLS